MGDGCNLECIKKVKPKVHEFVGPVKIVLIDPPKNEYCKKMWGAALVAIAIFFMGFTSMSIFFYTLSFSQKFEINLHILLCSLGYQLLLPVGILNLNPLNGPAMVMKITDRKIEHMIVQIIGVLCVVVGTGAALYKDDLDKIISLDLITPHCISGILAGVLVFFALIFGPLALLLNGNHACVRCIKITHMVFGLLAFLSSSVCFILGLLKPSLEVWYDPVPSMIHFSIGFVIFYTFVVIYGPIVKWTSAV